MNQDLDLYFINCIRECLGLRPMVAEGVSARSESSVRSAINAALSTEMKRRELNPVHHYHGVRT